MSKLNPNPHRAVLLYVVPRVIDTVAPLTVAPRPLCSPGCSEEGSIGWVRLRVCDFSANHHGEQRTINFFEESLRSGKP